MKKDAKLLIGLTIFVALIITFLTSYFALSSKQQKKQPVICPDDVMMCPGGAAVSRSGSDCSFTPCPSDTLPTKSGIVEDPIEVPDNNGDDKNGGGVYCTEDAKMCPDGSYVGRQGPRCEFAPCPPSDGKNFAL